MAITDPARVAAAAPIRAAAATANTGTGTDHRGRSARSDQRAAADHGQHRVHLGDHLLGQRWPAASPTRPAPTSTSTAGASQINGAPATGDTFTVRSNAGATGDNRNAFALADALQRRRARRRHRCRSSSAVERTHRRRRAVHAHRADESRCREPRQRQRSRRARRGVGRQPRRGSGQHAALPAGLRRPRRRSSRSPDRCSTRCSTRCGDKPCAFPPPACIAPASTPSSSTRSSSRRRRTRSPPARSSRPQPKIRSAPTRAAGLDRTLADNAQYERNSNIIESRLSYEEQTLADITSVLQSARDSALAGRECHARPVRAQDARQPGAAESRGPHGHGQPPRWQRRVPVRRHVDRDPAVRAGHDRRQLPGRPDDAADPHQQHAIAGRRAYRRRRLHGHCRAQRRVPHDGVRRPTPAMRPSVWAR